MKKIYIPYTNNQHTYLIGSCNIINDINSNYNKAVLNNSSLCIYHKENANDLNVGKNIYNSQINKENGNIKELQLNQIKNIENNINLQKYIPFSSRNRKVMKNNFIFYNDNDNKTIHEINQQNERKNFSPNLQSKNIFKSKINKNNSLKKQVIYPTQADNDIKASRKIIHPTLNELNIKDSLFDSSNLYQTPKNILFCGKCRIDLQDEVNGKIKYKKIFNEARNKNNKTLEKNNYDSYNNLQRKTFNNNLKINTRDCITPFFCNRYVQKIQKININQYNNNTKINNNNNNNNTEINNTIKKIYKNTFSYNPKINKEPEVKTQKNQNIIGYKDKKQLYLSNDINNNKEKKIQKVYSEIVKKDIIRKETIQPRDILLSEDFDYDNKKMIYYQNRFTNYENKKIKNNLYKNHLESAKILSKQRQTFKNTSYINNDFFSENKENINMNLNINQNTFLNEKEINNFEFKLNEYKNIKANNKSKLSNNLSFGSNNFDKIIINNKPNLINKSAIIKKDVPVYNNLKKDKLRYIFTNETNNFKAKPTQFISLSKVKNDDMYKLKVELNDYKNKVDINLNNGKKANKKQIKNNKDIIVNKNNENKKIIKNKIKENPQSKNLKLNIKDNILFSSKPGQNNNNCIDLYKNNNNLDIFLNSPSQLNKSNIILSQQSQTTLNTSKNLYRFTSNSYKSKYSNIKTISEENKYIFSLYYQIPQNKKYKNISISVICFDPEETSFKTKRIENKNNFYKYFYEAINKVNNKNNKSIYLMKNEDYFIVTGGNCNKFYKYIFKENKLEQKMNLKYNHSNGRLISYNDQIICLSGNYSKKVEIFSEKNNIWNDLPEMQVERSYFSCCIIKNRYLFVFFGYNCPKNVYLDTIEYFDILSYNINMLNQTPQNNNNIYWKYLKYNFFNSNKRINLIGAIAINYHDEKIIILGGRNNLDKERNKGYYQFILDENDMNSDEVNSYIERISNKNLDMLGNNCFFDYDYRFIEELNRNNVMKENTFVAFDNNHNIHLIKLATMNHEIYNFNK